MNQDDRDLLITLNANSQAIKQDVKDIKKQTQHIKPHGIRIRFLEAVVYGSLAIIATQVARIAIAWACYYWGG